MSARHHASTSPSRTRRHLLITVPVIMTLIVALVLIGELAISRRGHGALTTETVSVLGPATGAASASRVSTRSASAQLRAGSERRLGARPVTLPPAALKHIDGAAAGDAATVITALTADLGADAVSVAALNLSTGASFTFGATAAMTMGSIAKLDILETLLLQHQDDQTTLSDDDVSLTASMIEQSDNDATDVLWAEIGGNPAVQAANERLGVATLVAGPDGYWGLGTTGGREQLTLLENLVTSGGPLAPASQAYALGLMRGVDTDQRWGVGAVADPGTAFANKNGWLSNDADDDLWSVNSDGIVTVHGQQLLISVLTQHNDSEPDGITLVEQIAAAVAAAISGS